MAGIWRVGTVSVILATWSTMAGRSAEAQLSPLSLTVAIHDYAALSPPVLERAKGVVTTIYGRIDVSVRWLDGPQVAEERPTNPTVRAEWPAPLIRLRLLRRSADPRRPAGDLGFAVPGSRLASVLVERVEYVANSKQQDVGDLLGVVMAHEIGHLLLPLNPHSAAGVMAAKVDLFLSAHGTPSFDPGQATMIRARIASVWGGVERSAEAQNQRLPMRVVVYDYTDAEPAILQQAQRAVTRIFGEIEVDVTWLDVAQFTREMPSEPAERQAFVATVIQVSVLPPAMHKALGKKGTVVGGAGLNTRRIWISFPRVQETARRARADASDVLGYVIAHEIAHVLMPAGSHALSGLMQRSVDPQVIAHNRLSFGSDEAQLIRAALARDPSR